MIGINEKQRQHNRSSRKQTMFVLLLLATFTAVAATVWAGATIQITQRRVSLDSGLVAHYTLDGPETELSPYSGGSWVQATASAAFGGRARTQSILSYDGRLWLMGGWDGTSLRDMWYSYDGATWTLATNSLPFAGSTTTQENTVFDGKMWKIGGGSREVWWSTDGVNWTRATSDAGWTGGSSRNQHAVTVFDGRMWLMGGTSGGVNRNDVWYSYDGATWTQATASAAWSARQNHRVTTYNGRMWLIGGGSSNEVWWSTDGANWTRATADGGWGGGARYVFGLTVYDNKMWVIAGYGGSTPTSGVWWSEDGVNWTLATANPGFAPRAEVGATVHNGRIWIAGGISGSTYFSDVWSSAAPSVNYVRDSSGNNHHGSYMGVNQRTTMGRIGQALHFDGVSDYIAVGDTSATARTISFWMKRDLANVSILRLSNSASVSVDSSGNITTTGISSPTIYIDGSAGVATGTTWQHVVITSSTPIAVSNLELGRNGSSYFNGALDDVRLYSQVLAPGEIGRVYHLGATTKIGTTLRPEFFEDRLVAHWSFDANNMDYVPALPERVLEDTDSINPNRDGGSGGPGGGTFSLVGCGPEIYDCLSDSERYPDAPDTSTDYVKARGQSYANFYQETIPSIDRVTGVNVYVYHSEPNEHTLWIKLEEHDGTPSTVISKTQLPWLNSPGWSVLSRTGLNLSQEELDSLSLEFECVKGTGGGNPDCSIYSAYIDVTYEYTAPPTSSSGLVLDTKSSFNGTVNGVGVGVGRVGQAVYFDGVNQNIVVGAGPTTVNTISFWVNPTSATQSLMQLNGSTNITASSGSINANGFSSPTIYVDGVATSDLTPNKWQFVTITSPTSINASDIVFGKVGASHFEGVIDDVRMYNAVLTADEISRAHHLGATSYVNKTIKRDFLANGLVAYWSFDGPTVSGSTVSDVSSNNNNGTFSDGPTIGIGRLGQGAVFGAAGTLRVPYHSTLNPRDEVSYAAWIKWDGGRSQAFQLQTIIMNGAWNRSLRITESTHWNGARRLLLSINIGGVERELYSDGEVMIGEWNHVVATYDGSTAALYINGALAGSASYSGQIISSTGPTDIGSENNIGSRYSGLLDEVRIYNRAISATEVQRLYELGR